MAFRFDVCSSDLPKPHTPFQWHSVSTAELLRKQELLRDAFRTIRGIKVNYTDVRISAMEDFVGRGDRRLGSVVKRAWQLGAGMDAWWESLDKAFGAWTQAIEESGLSWKYRQVEDGEWDIFQPEQSEAVGSYRLPEVNKRLPWDHLDTGIDKTWLHDDLKRALEAAVVPDCAFEGCSHCGVCGVDFGHNIVIPPPPIPPVAGNFEPNQTRVQRIRLWFGKQGDMALVSHLDLMRLFDRAIRRAAIPISFTGGYHPSPRIIPANALSLGVTSCGEIIDFELTQSMSIEAFCDRLSVQLPDDLPLVQAREVPLDQPSATQLLEKAEYQITLRVMQPELQEHSDTQPQIQPELPQWQDWCDRILAQSELWIEKQTKSGKLKRINLREQLFELHALATGLMDDPIDALSAKLSYVGSCRNDGTFLRPDQVLHLLEQVSGRELQLQRIQRSRLILADGESLDG